MERHAHRLRAARASFALAVALVLSASSAFAAPRSVLVTWRYPVASAPYTGVALVHAASLSDLVDGRDLTRVDLGLPAADGNGVANSLVPGFDDARPYYIALRVYDDQGRESANSGVGVVAPRISGSLYGDDFESYRDGQDPEEWEDSASGTTALGDAALFETVELGDGTIAFGTRSADTDIHSHFLTSAGRSWSSYEFSGRILSETLGGSAGVTVLSEFPTALSYYRLARSGAGAFELALRGAGELRCESSPSTGVSAQPGTWLRFRVRVTRFGDRNRIRALVHPDGSSAPGWQIDCWDRNPRGVASGSVGVYASNAAGTFWDDLQVLPVVSDGAPPAYQPETPPAPPPPPPPPPSAYTSASKLMHWWAPGWDMAALGRDFAGPASGRVDVAAGAKGVSAKDIVDGGKSVAFVDLNGKSESLGSKSFAHYGIGDRWSLSAWVRPAALAKKKPRYIVDLNGDKKRSQNRISLVLDAESRFAIELSDASGRTRALAAQKPIDGGALGKRWYHVVAVKAGNTLALYVDGQLVSGTDVGVPLQDDAERLLRVGGRLKVKGKGAGFAGAINSVGLWSSALGGGEVRALFANGNRSFDPR